MGKSLLEIIVNGQDNFSTPLTKGLQRIGEGMTRVGQTMTAAVTAPIVAMGVVAVNAASNLSESLNKVNVVFGDAAASVTNFASTAAQNLGMSEQAALEAAGTFGNLFTAMGLGQDTSADMSQSLLTLAADLASFNNIDPTVALEKLRAGLVGEIEPLRTLGVNLSAAAVEAKALEMGLIREGEELTAAAKAQASYALIMEQTTNAQGDFKRTSEGLANQTRILKAQFMDTAAKLGTLLLPYAQMLVQWLSKIMAWVQALNPEQQKMAVIIAAVAAAIGPLLMVLGTLLTSFSAIATFVSGPLLAALAPVIAVIAAIIAVAVLLYLAWTNNWGGIQEKTAEAVEFIKGIVASFLEGLKAFWEAHKTEIMGLVNAIWGFLKSAFEAGKAVVTAIVSALTAAIQAFWSAHGEQVMAILGALWAWIEDTFSVFVSVFTSIFQAFSLAFQGDWRGFGEKLREAWDALWAWIKDTVSKAWDAIKSIDWASVGTAIIEGIKNGIVAAAKGLAAAAVAAAGAALEAVKGFLGISSPSKVFAQLGQNMMIGMAQGIGQSAGYPVQASRSAAQATTLATTNYYTMNLSTNAPVSTLARDFEIMRSMA